MIHSDKAKPTILSFIDWYRPGYKAGGTITAFGNMVDHLSPHFNFKIVTRNADYLETKPYEHIHSDEWNRVDGHSIFYMSPKTLTYSKIKDLINSTPHDWIYVNGMFSFYFSILPVLFSSGKNCVVNPHGMLSNQAFSVKSTKKRLFLKLANLLKLYKHCRFQVANSQEAKAVSNRVKHLKDIRISNQLPRLLSDKSINNETNKSKELLKLISVTRISVEKGVLKMIKSFSSLGFPTQLDLYGAIYDEDYWNQCLKAIEELPRHVEVVYRGSAKSEEIPSILRAYDFFVLLSEGENFGHAILEALGCGIPVLISDNTPWQEVSKRQLGWEIDVNNREGLLNIYQTMNDMDFEVYSAMSSRAKKFYNEFSKDERVLSSNIDIFS